MSKTKKFSLDEVARHNSKQDIYIVYHGKVCNVTSFIDEHPGGEELILEVAGKDATEAFDEVGHSKEAQAQLAELEIGVLDGDTIIARNNPHTEKETAMGEGLSLVFWCGLIFAVGAIAFGGHRYVYLT